MVNIRCSDLTVLSCLLLTNEFHFTLFHLVFIHQTIGVCVWIQILYIYISITGVFLCGIGAFGSFRHQALGTAATSALSIHQLLTTISTCWIGLELYSYM